MIIIKKNITTDINSFLESTPFLGKRSQVDDVTHPALNKSPIRLHYILLDFPSHSAGSDYSVDKPCVSSASLDQILTPV